MFRGWKKEKRSWFCEESQRDLSGRLPLSEAQTGKLLKVTSIKGGRGLCARMAALGIYPGVEMEVVCSGCGSPCLVRIQGGTVSLGSGVAQNILVQGMV